MSSDNLIVKAGFDPARLRQSLATAIASCFALAFAWRIGLEHPQWSAMTVWIASQPFRGQMLEKSFFRIVGTFVGVCVGVALGTLAGGKLEWIVVGLALWVSLCAGAGNIYRGFVSYGSMLAGYSTAMVALLDTAHPDHVIWTGIDRFLTVLVGVVAAILMGWVWAQRRSADELTPSVCRLTAALLQDLAHRGSIDQAAMREKQRSFLSQLSAIDDGLDPHTAGSIRSRAAARRIRTILSTQISALLLLRQADPSPIPGALRSALEQTASTLDPFTSVEATLRLLNIAAVIAENDRPMANVLRNLASALEDHFGAADTAPARMHFPPLLILHRDWVGAREALLRSLFTMLAVGGIWLMTGWSGGPFMLLGTAIMTSLFSTFDNPAHSMRWVFLGQLAGVVGFLVCRWIVWPHAADGAQLVMMVTPFILFGALLSAHRGSMLFSFDFNMVLLLLLQPSFPLNGTFPHSLELGGAVLAAPTLAFIAYKTIYPIDAGRRITKLVAMMVHELQSLAGSSTSLKMRSVWRARLYHRLLRLARWTEKSRYSEFSVTDGSLAVLEVGSCAFRIREILNDTSLSPSLAECLRTALRKIETIARTPEEAQHQLAVAAGKLANTHRDDSLLLKTGATLIEENLAFFRRGRGGWRGQRLSK